MYYLPLLQLFVTSFLLLKKSRRVNPTHSRIKAMTRAAHDMIRSILNDTVSDFNGLRNWLDNLGGIRADEQIISSYVEQGNYTDALTLANMLPELYKLTGNGLTEHGYYMEMLNLLITLGQEGRTIADLKSIEEENIITVAETSNSVAGAIAQSILEANSGKPFVDCPQIFGNVAYKSSSINLGALGTVYNVRITVKPNPASEWAAFDYTLPDEESAATITITDGTGKTVETLDISGKQGQKLWDVRKIDSGIYLYTLKVGTFNGSGKIVISK